LQLSEAKSSKLLHTNRVKLDIGHVLGYFSHSKRTSNLGERFG